MSDPALESGVLTFLAIGLVGSLALLLVYRRTDSPYLPALLFLAAFGLRFTASIALYRFGLVEFIGDEDSSGWVHGASLHDKWVRCGVELWQLPIVALQELRENHAGYQVLLASLFQLNGSPGRLSAAAFGCGCGALTVVLTYQIARALFTSRIAFYSGWLACVFPSLILWSSQTTKEPVVIVLETAILYTIMQARRNRCRLELVVLATVLITLLCQHRYYAGYIAAAAVATTLAVPSAGCRPPRAALASLVFLLFLTAEFSALDELGRMFRLNTIFRFHSVSFYQNYRESLASRPIGSGSSIRIGHDLHDPLGFLGSLATGAAYLLFAPFPWNFTGGSRRLLATAPEQIIWWLLVFGGVFPGLRYAIRLRRGDLLPFFVFFGVLGACYSLMLGNIGLAYRQRAQFLPFLLVIAVVGLAERFRRGKASELSVGDQPG